jgi:uncharacterized protein (DUF697 family)
VSPDAPPGATTPDAALVVSPRLPLDARLAAFVHHLQRARVPVVVVHLAVPAGGAVPAPTMKGYLVVSDLGETSTANIAAALVELLPADRRLAFAHQLPPFRGPVFDVTIEETARANATYALTTGLAWMLPGLNIPIYLGDAVVMTKNQLLMGYRIVLGSGRDGEPRKLIGEIVGVLGGGMLFRQLARKLAGLIPFVGLVSNVAVAYGGTWTMGRAIVLWATEGRAATGAALRALTKEGLERGRRLAKELVARARPTQRALSRPSRWSRFKAALPGHARRSPPAPPGPSPTDGPRQEL